MVLLNVPTVITRVVIGDDPRTRRYITSQRIHMRADRFTRFICGHHLQNPAAANFTGRILLNGLVRDCSIDDKDTTEVRVDDQMY